ncbi:MAG: hypothetical protein ACETWR_17820 [Anaerolineae bacterium]
MLQYSIEDIIWNHPRILADLFVSPAISLCRKWSQQPFSLAIERRSLPIAGSGQSTVDFRWSLANEADADRIENTLQAQPLTEFASIGLCCATFNCLNEGEITEVTKRGDGIDYWIDDRRAVLEVSGLGPGSSGDLSRLHHRKESQLKDSGLFKLGYPGYVYVIVFQIRSSIFSYHS